MEWVSWLAGEPWSYRPRCVSPVIAAFVRRWQDDMDYDDRQILRPYVRKVLGTNTGPADDVARTWLVVDWTVRTYLPAWLRAAGLADHGSAVAGLAPVRGPADLKAARPIVAAAANRAAVARRPCSAGTGTGGPGPSAGEAAVQVAGNATRTAAGTWDATVAAAWYAAEAAAWDAVRPTIDALQASALDLLDDLIAVGRPA